jgi:hypothetical protein
MTFLQLLPLLLHDLFVGRNGGDGARTSLWGGMGKRGEGRGRGGRGKGREKSKESLYPTTPAHTAIRHRLNTHITPVVLTVY